MEKSNKKKRSLQFQYLFQGMTKEVLLEYLKTHPRCDKDILREEMDAIGLAESEIENFIRQYHCFHCGHFGRCGSDENPRDCCFYYKVCYLRPMFQRVAEKAVAKAQADPKFGCYLIPTEKAEGDLLASSLPVNADAEKIAELIERYFPEKIYLARILEPLSIVRLDYKFY